MKKKIIFDSPVIVMKFGGTSLRNDESRSNAVEHIRNQFELGNKIVVVVSAMGRKGEPYATDTLISLMKKIGEPVNPEELDSVISIGETLSASVFSHLLNQNNLPAESFTGSKAGILTDNNPGNAEIIKIDPIKIKFSIDRGKIAVVAGFQGVTKDGEVRTLGRGGSDTSAVALGSALNAEFVEIFSDVDGIANCDPNKIPEASFIEKISVEQVLNMANEGSKVIHARAVKASMKRKTKIILRNTFSNAKGTLIYHKLDKKKIKQIILSHRENMVLIEINSKNNLKKLFPEMIFIDKRRCILKDDVYLDVRIDAIKKMYGEITKKRGWATISLIFDKKEGKNFVFPDAEIIFSSEKIIRYLVNEKKLFATLRLLVNHYNMI